MGNEKTALAIRETASELEQYPEQEYNVLLPVTEISEIPAGAKLAVRQVRISVENETYAVDRGRRALSGVALDRIAAAAGVTFISERRTDDRKHPHYCSYEVVAEITDLDGTRRRKIGTKTIDLRDDCGDGTPGPRLAQITSTARAKGRNPSRQLLQEREYIDSYCASKAKNRAVRQLIGLRSAYDPKELRKPFVAPKLVPDTSNPEARQMVLAQMTGAAAALYGQPQLPQSSQVIEASVSEVPPPGDNGAEPEPDFESEPIMPEVLDFSQLWELAQSVGLDQAAMAELCRSATGKQGRNELTESDLQAIHAAISDFDSQGDDNPDGVPF